MHLAIDLDGTLADIHTPAIQRSQTLDAYQPNEFTTDDWNEYKHRSQNVWHNHHDEIPLVEDCVPTIMQTLHQDHELTILTHRRKVNDQIRAWLDSVTIPYDHLHPTHHPKREYTADVYVDDNPVEGASGLVLLRDQPWNQSYTTGFDHRIHTLEHVPENLPLSE